MCTLNKYLSLFILFLFLFMDIFIRFWNETIETHEFIMRFYDLDVPITFQYFITEVMKQTETSYAIIIIRCLVCFALIGIIFWYKYPKKYFYYGIILFTVICSFHNLNEIYLFYEHGHSPERLFPWWFPIEIMTPMNVLYTLMIAECLMYFNEYLTNISKELKISIKETLLLFLKNLYYNKLYSVYFVCAIISVVALFVAFSTDYYFGLEKLYRNLFITLVPFFLIRFIQLKRGTKTLSNFFIHDKESLRYSLVYAFFIVWILAPLVHVFFFFLCNNLVISGNFLFYGVPVLDVAHYLARFSAIMFFINAFCGIVFFIYRFIMLLKKGNIVQYVREILFSLYAIIPMALLYQCVLLCVLTSFSYLYSQKYSDNIITQIVTIDEYQNKNIKVSDTEKKRTEELVYAILEDNITKVKMLVEDNVNINLEVTIDMGYKNTHRSRYVIIGDTYTQTPLRFATYARKLESVQYLLEKGALVNTRHESPLTVAIERNFYELIPVFIDAGLTINTKTMYDNSISETRIKYIHDYLEKNINSSYLLGKVIKVMWNIATTPHP